ncbi:uncharacterized protein LOC127831289 [Dreissena polymorpha]|uniref:Uncharacterized protein n=1 Tax=Dreissena polymorpha TaxID=45954 RepID=A0A9D4JWB6_DREPO|nr:uncharacterized protein LOC127831289 [Dreissena polymorpha]KAH3822798.1 hypothetical protein DPMN_124589 [Dreissena polymorpha]
MSLLHLYVVLACSVIGNSQHQTDAPIYLQYQTDAPINVKELDLDIESTTARTRDVGITKSLEGLEVPAVYVTEFDEFCAAIKERLHVTDEMLRLPEVREWFEENFTSKHIRFDPENPIYIQMASANLATIWCSFCQSTNNCPCIRRFCFNVTC